MVVGRRCVCCWSVGLKCMVRDCVTAAVSFMHFLLYVARSPQMIRYARCSPTNSLHSRPRSSSPVVANSFRPATPNTSPFIHSVHFRRRLPRGNQASFSSWPSTAACHVWVHCCEWRHDRCVRCSCAYTDAAGSTAALWRNCFYIIITLK